METPKLNELFVWAEGLCARGILEPAVDELIAMKERIEKLEANEKNRLALRHAMKRFFYMEDHCVRMDTAEIDQWRQLVQE
jgi:hypothetical protein